jgi:hypothetical protein
MDTKGNVTKDTKVTNPPPPGLPPPPRLRWTGRRIKDTGPAFVTARAGEDTEDTEARETPLTARSITPADTHSPNIGRLFFDATCGML